MRADAQRNREAITTVALELIVRRGAAVSMEEIARAAGVGVGTLYRHFPDRQALLESIAVNALHDLLTFSRNLVDQDLPGWEALRALVDHFTGQPLALIKSMTDTTAAEPKLAALRDELDSLVERVAARAQRQGTMRGDVPPSEVVGLLNVVVCRPGARPDDHLATVVLDGLRAGAPAQATATPLSGSQSTEGS